MSNSQKQKIISRFREKGYVDRNWALQNYISRLGAIIYQLSGDPRFDYLEFEGKWGYELPYCRDEDKKNYFYFPKKKIEVKREMTEQEKYLHTQGLF